MRTSWKEYFDLEARYAAAARAEGLSPSQARVLAQRLAPRHHHTRRTDMTDPTKRALEVADWLTARRLPSTQDNIDAAFEALGAAEPQKGDIPPAPDPYEIGLKKLRTAHATAESTFAADYRQRGLRELQAMRD